MRDVKLGSVDRLEKTREYYFWLTEVFCPQHDEVSDIGPELALYQQFRVLFGSEGVHEAASVHGVNLLLWDKHVELHDLLTRVNNMFFRGSWAS